MAALSQLSYSPESVIVGHANTDLRVNPRPGKARRGARWADLIVPV
ncbi:MAG: hypothetical protein QOF69_3346, partial [Solirubrobacteraceae bacterium]|nr:hypothetical protein [Solirubrobacteraceae bacterium]